MGDSKYQEILPEVSVSLPQEVKKVEIDLMPEIPLAPQTEDFEIPIV
jgi:hypothetical protein